MGSGIAQVAATSGHEVLLCDPSQEALQRSEDSIGASLSRLLRKGALSEGDAVAARDRITRLTELQGLEAADFVVEAATEKEQLKQSIFQTLDQVAPPHCILATNTSSISITRLAATTGRPEKVVRSPWPPVPFRPTPFQRTTVFGANKSPAMAVTPQLWHSTLEGGDALDEPAAADEPDRNHPRDAH